MCHGRVDRFSVKPVDKFSTSALIDNEIEPIIDIQEQSEKMLMCRRLVQLIYVGQM